MTSSDNRNNEKYLFFAWVISCMGMGGSLFFSEVMDFIPCTLCWYQRICMYPLVVILLIGLIKKDYKAVNYATPFVYIGLLLAGYHCLIQYGIINESASPCVAGIPCSVKYIEWFGYITIPVLSFIGFLSINSLFSKIK